MVLKLGDIVRLERVDQPHSYLAPVRLGRIMSYVCDGTIEVNWFSGAGYSGTGYKPYIAYSSPRRLLLYLKVINS